MLMRDLHLPQYKQYRIAAKPLSLDVSNYAIGFGWAFHAFAEYARTPSFIVVLRSLFGWQDDDNLDKALELGEQCVHDVIDRVENPGGTYCFRCEPGPGGPIPVTEVDCNDISVD